MTGNPTPFALKPSQTLGVRAILLAVLAFSAHGEVSLSPSMLDKYLILSSLFDTTKWSVGCSFFAVRCRKILTFHVNKVLANFAMN